MRYRHHNGTATSLFAAMARMFVPFALGGACLIARPYPSI